MEKFNIEEFNKNAIGGIYDRTLENGTRVMQFGNPNSGYVENTTPVKGWYYEQCQFFGNGFLKSKGKLFKKGDFKSGLWLMYDSVGNKTEEIDYDSQFELTLEDVFSIIERKNIPFSLNNIYNDISRGNATPDSPLIWVVEWKAFPDRIERIIIDDATGKITNQEFTPFNENH